jgi:phosphoglycerate dehydrogenase-like enzyme
VILVDPLPRTLEMICDAETRTRLEALGPLVVHENGPMPDGVVDEHVLNASPAFALPVVEMALGMAIDLARGISAADRAMRAGTERYGLDSNDEAFLISGRPVGIVGFGDLGRELHRLIAPFRCPVKVHDPWLPDLVIRRAGAEPASLDELLSSSRVVFVFASVTSDNEGFLGRAELERMQPGAILLLMSRAGVVDFAALADVVASGRIRAATDVFPDEPVAGDDPVREQTGLLLSPHRAGGMREAFLQIGRLAVADLELILAGLPPVACKRAERETAGRLRSRPVNRS